MKKEPYLIEKVVTIVRKYNSNYGDDIVCKCGHAYYRHFDTYEDMYACGCKYCGCYTFAEPTVYAIHDNYFSHDEREGVEFSVSSNAPSWLGKFKLKHHLRNKVPKALEHIVQKMELLVPDQKFTSVFLQSYSAGDSVKLHRDPKNNVGKTVIAIFGSFSGGQTTIHNDDNTVDEFILFRGDVLVLDCTIDGKQGPAHEVSTIISGQRYAIILNTINGMEYGEKDDTVMEKFLKETQCD